MQTRSTLRIIAVLLTSSVGALLLNAHDAAAISSFGRQLRPIRRASSMDRYRPRTIARTRPFTRTAPLSRARPVTLQHAATRSSSKVRPPIQDLSHHSQLPAHPLNNALIRSNYLLSRKLVIAAAQPSVLRTGGDATPTSRPTGQNTPSAASVFNNNANKTVSLKAPAQPGGAVPYTSGPAVRANSLLTEKELKTGSYFAPQANPAHKTGSSSGAL